MFGKYQVLFNYECGISSFSKGKKNSVPLVATFNWSTEQKSLLDLSVIFSFNVIKLFTAIILTFSFVEMVFYQKKLEQQQQFIVIIIFI